MIALYNEIEPYPAQWLRNLVQAGHIAPGEVDERSIKDLKPEDVNGYKQVRFFAGIGIWSYALRLAGWPDELEVWTGSCPCQPFSQAGRRKGTDDERHLWPEWFRLIRECKPVVVFGEQVASKDGLAWLDIVFDDLEGAGYTCRAFDLCAAGVGAPHIRQRLYFVAVREDVLADDDEGQREQRRAGLSTDKDTSQWHDVDGRGANDALAYCERERLQTCDVTRTTTTATSECGADDGMVHSAVCGHTWTEARGRQARSGTEHGSDTRGFWSNTEWLPCTDGKSRPVEPGTFPLAHGVAARVGRLRAFGNALVAPLAAEFIGVVMEALGIASVAY